MAEPDVAKRNFEAATGRALAGAPAEHYAGGAAASTDAGSSEAAARHFAEAVAIMARLRGPAGCPWDRDQDFDSIRKHTLEEAYEVLDAIERRNWPDLQDELGDLLLQVLFYAQMASEPGYFNIADVVAGLNRKLVRRHPHVFGDEASRAAGNGAAGVVTTKGIDAAQVLRNWEAIKRAEKRALTVERTIAASDGPANEGRESPSLAVTLVESRLHSVPRSMPALMEAAKLGSRASKSGFDWPNADGLFAKIEEEAAELREAIGQRGDAAPPLDHGDPVAEELGDLLFTVVNLARKLKVDPELALRGTNAKFRRRFGAMEAASTRPLEELPPERLEELWAAAKRDETARPPAPSEPL